LVAASLWLGGVVFFLVVMGPAAQELEPKVAIRTMNQGRIGLEALSWSAIGLILLTGTFGVIARVQSAAPFDSAFGVLLAVKLFLFAAMTVHHCLQVFKYGPHIGALTRELPPGTALWPEPLLSHWRRWFLLLKINAALGPVAVLIGLALIES
jgi:putative copper export protein